MTSFNAKHFIKAHLPMEHEDNGDLSFSGETNKTFTNDEQKKNTKSHTSEEGIVICSNAKHL